MVNYLEKNYFAVCLQTRSTHSYGVESCVQHRKGGKTWTLLFLYYIWKGHCSVTIIGGCNAVEYYGGGGEWGWLYVYYIFKFFLFPFHSSTLYTSPVYFNYFQLIFINIYMHCIIWPSSNHTKLNQPTIALQGYILVNWQRPMIVSLQNVKVKKSKQATKKWRSVWCLYRFMTFGLCFVVCLSACSMQLNVSLLKET